MVVEKTALNFSTIPKLFKSAASTGKPKPPITPAVNAEMTNAITTLMRNKLSTNNTIIEITTSFVSMNFP